MLANYEAILVSGSDNGLIYMTARKRMVMHVLVQELG